MHGRVHVVLCEVFGGVFGGGGVGVVDVEPFDFAFWEFKEEADGAYAGAGEDVGDAEVFVGDAAQKGDVDVALEGDVRVVEGWRFFG